MEMLLFAHMGTGLLPSGALRRDLFSPPRSSAPCTRALLCAVHRGPPLILSILAEACAIVSEEHMVKSAVGRFLLKCRFLWLSRSWPRAFMRAIPMLHFPSPRFLTLNSD